MRAALLIRSGDLYKAAVWAEGLRRHGYTVEAKWQRTPRPDDLLVLWNRSRAFEPIAQIYERHGARVVIAENGFTRQVDGGKHYALFLDRHNGAGRWFVGEGLRHPIAEQPWRSSGRHVLVLPQRGIGSPGVAMPNTWGQAVLKRLQAMTDRPIVLRAHPGHRKTGQPDTLPRDLENAHCAVTWGSGAGVKALQAGVPVFHELGHWIAAPAARRLDGQVENCDTPERRIAWERISWAQWNLAEIGTGEAFDGLLNAPRGDLFCAVKQPLDDHRQSYAGRGHPLGGAWGAEAVDQLSRPA